MRKNRIFVLFILLISSILCEGYPTDTDDLTTSTTSVPKVFVNSTVFTNQTIGVTVGLSENYEAVITGYKLYFTSDPNLSPIDKSLWESIELLTSERTYDVLLDQNKIPSLTSPLVSLRLFATVFSNQVESSSSEILTVEKRETEVPLPTEVASLSIESVEVLSNGTLQIVFSTTAVNISDLSLDFKNAEETHARWAERTNLSINGNSILVDLPLNKTYTVQLRLDDIVSQEERATVHITARLPSVFIHSGDSISLDPDSQTPLHLTCTAMDPVPSKMYWKVNNITLPPDHIFYSVQTVISEDEGTSTISAKARTRSDLISCYAIGVGGESSTTTQVDIMGPGTPPNQITLQADRNGWFVVHWQAPTHPNGNITKYVLYFTASRELPLSDWNKMDLDGRERSARINSLGSDSFFIRIQAVSESGPGIISQVVASQKSALPISVYIEGSEDSNVLNPNQQIEVQCRAKGTPRPTLQYAISKNRNQSMIEPDEWISLESLPDGDITTSKIIVDLLTSKFLHCKAASSAGVNYTMKEYKVNKPGDSPHNVSISQIDPLDVLLEWDSPLFPNLQITHYEIQVSHDTEEDEDNWQKYETIEGNRLMRYSIPIDQLKPSTNYFVRIRAVNSAGVGPFSHNIEFITPNGGPEKGPERVNVYINEANTAILSWEQPNTTVEITGFIIYFTRDPSSADTEYNTWQYLEVGPLARNYKLDYQVGLKPKTLYRVRIVPKNEIADGPPSTVVEFETAHTELPIPTDISVSLEEDNTATVTFTAVRDPQDHSKTLEEYRVDLSRTEDIINPRWTAVQSENIRKAVDTQTSKVTLTINGTMLLKNAKYWIRIKAIPPGHHVKGTSKPRLFTTGDGKLSTKVEILGSPEIARDPNNGEELRIECRGEGSPAPDIRWYWNGREMKEIIENQKYEWNDNQWKIEEDVEHRLTISTLIREKTIESGELSCEAVNVEGNETDSAVLRILGPGSSPENITIVPYRNEMNLTWMQPRLPNGNITKYIVYYTDNSNDDLSDWIKVETSSLSLNFNAIAPLTVHIVRVQSVSQWGPGIISDPIVAISDERYESLIVNLVFNAGSSEVEAGIPFHFSCVGKGNPPPEVFYRWEFGEEIEVKTTTVETDKDAFVAATYASTFLNRTLICKVINKYEEREAKAEVIVRKPGDAPSNVIWSVQDDDTVKLTWDQISYPNGNNLKYKLYLGNLEEIVDSPPVVLTKLPRAVNVSLQITAVNEYGEGPRSTQRYFVTPSGAPRDPPIIRTINSINNKVTIAWESPMRPQGTIKWYTIYFCVSNESESDWQSITVPGTTFTYTLDERTKLMRETVYHLRMSATNENDEGPLSAIFSFDTLSSREPSILFHNITAQLETNQSIVIHFQDRSGREYSNYIVYIREETEINWRKYEAANLTAANELRIIHNFSIIPMKRYLMRLTGISDGNVIATSETFPLKVEQSPLFLSGRLFSNSSDPSLSLDEDGQQTEERKQIEEPPLFKL